RVSGWQEGGGGGTRAPAQVAPTASTSVHLMTRLDGAKRSRMKLVERGAQPLEPDPQALGIAADPDAKMIRQLEEATRHHPGFVTFAGEATQRIRVAAAAQAWKRDGAEFGAHHLEVAAGGKEAVEQRPIGRQPGARLLPEPRQLAECNHAQLIRNEGAVV